MKNVVVSLAVIAAAGMSASAASFNDHASYLAATVNNVVINFDTDPAGNPLSSGQEIGSTYAAWGAEFPAGNFVGAAVLPVSSPLCWFNDTIEDGGPRFDVKITAPDITAVGVFNVLYSQGLFQRLTAYNGGGDALAFVDADNDINTLDFFGVTTAEPIAYVVIQFRDQYGWGVDDLHLGQVPSPGAAVLGLMGVAAVGRRRR
ncbi:MAG: hypothetical protein KF787_02835 [Phycisphaeraceae bacterium]|nr:hypothetical protein [Phycisphaerae bacterium]MBX3391563.1 hypothetical protein [Phycisphaeraceae bacterium]HRJ50274.1 hypothetical protein [Phycisphaerales bacterium]